MPVASIILVGGGEHARVVADVVRCANVTLRGFVDQPEARARASAVGVEYLGEDSVLARHPDSSLMLAFGSLSTWRHRLDVARRLDDELDRTWATVVHPTAFVSADAVVEPGSVVMAGAIVQPGARIGRHCVVNSGVIVEHDVIVGENVHLAPGVVIGGGARIGAGVYVGMRAALRDHVTVGANALVAMGSVVVADVADGSTVRGVPAR
jgi:acetyltransferase EpsM